MRDAACDTGVIIADAVALAELPGGTGHEQVRIDWLNKCLAEAPGSAGTSIASATWCGRSALGWLCGPGIGRAGRDPGLTHPIES